MIGKRWYSSLENSFQMILHRKEEERARLKCITQVWKREVSYQGKGKNFSSFVRSTALWTEWIEVLGRGFGRRKVALTFKVSRLSSSLSMQIAGNVGSQTKSDTYGNKGARRLPVLFNRLTCTIVSSKENLEVLSNAFACRVLKESLIEKKKKKE